MWDSPLIEVRGSNKTPWAMETLNCQLHLKSKVHSGASDSVSYDGGQEDAQAHQALGTMHWGSLHGLRDFLLLLRVPCRLSCRQLVIKERLQLLLNFTLGRFQDGG
jgi:hypothetical protein